MRPLRPRSRPGAARVPEDGRAFRVVLTEEGRRLAEALAAGIDTQVSALTSELSDTNRHRLSLLAGQVVHQHAAARGIDLSAGMAHPTTAIGSPS